MTASSGELVFNRDIENLFGTFYTSSTPIRWYIEKGLDYRYCQFIVSRSLRFIVSC
jgi:hypothetical protein